RVATISVNQKLMLLRVVLTRLPHLLPAFRGRDFDDPSNHLFNATATLVGEVRRVVALKLVVLDYGLLTLDLSSPLGPFEGVSFRVPNSCQMSQLLGYTPFEVS
ncbi:hypothetical protein AMTR_s00475p00008300, partial [Amborella trichopoda]